MKCELCNDTGLLIAIRKSDETKTPYSFRCHKCPASNELGISKKIVQFGIAIERVFEIQIK